jgi:hypothetical protein
MALRKVGVLLLCLLSASAAYAEETNETDIRIAVQVKATKAFAASDFAALEKMADEYRKNKSRTPSGVWKLFLFYDGLTHWLERVHDEKQITDTEAKIDSWAAAYPQSPTPHITKSMALVRHAWFYRGHDYADKVPKEAWKPFHDYIAQAHANLDKYKNIADTDPQWYQTMMGIAGTEGWDRPSFDALFKEAVEHEPYYYRTYNAALDDLLPKWNGDWIQVDNFVDSAERSTYAKEGHSLYARLYWYIAETNSDSNIFKDSLVSWPKMKQGFDDMIERYPDNWNLNHYLMFACLASDKPTVRTLFERLGTNVMPDALKLVDIQKCRQWAKTTP